MCLPIKSEQSGSPGSPGRSMLGLGALMMLACLAGPALAGAIGALALGVLVGAAGAIFTLALCAAVPAVVVVLRRRSTTGESARG
jgi:hypothetical protein